MDQVLSRLERLYHEVGPGLLAYLHRRLADRHAAEDLLQETFLTAVRGRDRLSQAVSARAWLYAIARNLAATAIRRRRLNESLPENVPAASAYEQPHQEAIRAAIAELPDVLRETLELRLRCELTYEEIAAVLDIPVGTVRSRLHLALRRLRAAVRGQEEDQG